MKPYYDDGKGIVIYCGDARDILPTIEGDAIITDPVWPNIHPDLMFVGDPQQLFDDAMSAAPSGVRRVCVWLGCQSDPRFMSNLPDRWPFLRMCYLRRSVPGYNGRCLVTGDALYCFGEWPEPRLGQLVLPGETQATSVPRNRIKHPCARNFDHARWVVKWWSQPGETIVDPFMGSGTTLLAAKFDGRKAIGIEVNEAHCETAVNRLAQGVLEFTE